MPESAGNSPLMQLAYCVHGALAAVSPYDIPREYKLKIREAIKDVEGIFSSTSTENANKTE